MKPSWGEVFKHNGWQFLIWVDQGFGLLVSTIFKEKGYGDLTLSANAFRWEQEGIRAWPRVWIDYLFFWQKEHCKASYRYEIERRHLPESMR